MSENILLDIFLFEFILFIWSLWQGGIKETPLPLALELEHTIIWKLFHMPESISVIIIAADITSYEFNVA